MPDDRDMLAAIAAAKARRLKHQAWRSKVAIATLVATAAAIVGITSLAHMPRSDAAAAEPPDRLSIEDAIMEAADSYDEFPSVEWEYWLGVNPDIVGWVTLEGTGIDHPIVRASTESPAFYLSHGIDGSVEGKGCIFLDSECEEDLDSMHTVVYGHNWNGGLMFADLARFADRDFATSHPRILLQTPNWKKRLKVQCVEIANGTDDTNVIGFADKEEMALWFQERFEASTIQLDASSRDREDIEHVYTFCTCADGSGDKRVLVYAIPSMNLRAASRDSASTA